MNTCFAFDIKCSSHFHCTFIRSRCISLTFKIRIKRSLLKSAKEIFNCWETLLIISLFNSPQNGNSFSHPLIGSHLIVDGPKISYPESHSYVASLSPWSDDFVCTRLFFGTAGGPQTAREKISFNEFQIE